MRFGPTFLPDTQLVPFAVLTLRTYVSIATNLLVQFAIDNSFTNFVVLGFTGVHLPLVYGRLVTQIEQSALHPVLTVMTVLLSAQR